VCVAYICVCVCLIHLCACVLHLCVCVSRMRIDSHTLSFSYILSQTFQTTTHCNTLQHTATHCSTLQHTANTATHCNITECLALSFSHSLQDTLSPSCFLINTPCLSFAFSRQHSITSSLLHTFSRYVCCRVLQSVAVCCSVL